jgi:hypothetical protein
MTDSSIDRIVAFLSNSAAIMCRCQGKENYGYELGAKETDRMEMTNTVMTMLKRMTELEEGKLKLMINSTQLST